MESKHILRAAANVANLSTPLGLLIAKAGGARLRAGGRGLVLAEGYRLGFPIAGAFTVGNVVIVPGTTMQGLRDRLADVYDHEDAHAWQYAYCLGLPFLPLYGAALAWSWLRTGNLGAANFFEKQAGLTSGGYPNLGKRPLREVFRRKAR